MNFCTATLSGCSVCPPPPFSESPASVNSHLEEQLLGVDVVDEAGVVLVHHGQLVAGRAHVQAAHGRRLLQQHDRQRVVHEDLQDLGTDHPRHLCPQHWVKTSVLPQVGNCELSQRQTAVKLGKCVQFEVSRADWLLQHALGHRPIQINQKPCILDSPLVTKFHYTGIYNT